MFKKYILISFSILIIPTFIFSIETGEIVGKVVDEEGSPLPGVTITIKGPSLLKELSLIHI